MDANAFWDNLRTDHHKCWNWRGGTVSYGYGALRFGRRHWVAHRLAWTLLKGQIPSGRCVLHRCDNPLCCNVEHLFLGSRADNNKDRALKGRSGDLRGMKHGGSVLTDKAVRLIRAKKELSGAELARRLGVTRATVNKVRRGESWTHL